jgi:hypothetical protein
MTDEHARDQADEQEHEKGSQSFSRQFLDSLRDDHPTTWTPSWRALMAARRAIALAPDPRTKLEALASGARSLAIPARHGFIEHIDVVDRLYEQAENCGLITEFGESVIVEAIGSNLEKFDPPEQANGHAAFNDMVPPLAGPDDYGFAQPSEPRAPKIEAPKIEACPYRWIDPASIPPRQFLFGRHYVRKTIGATIAAGGRAKTTLGLLEAASMASGRDLLSGQTIAPLRVWYINGEEDQDELDRRMAAICRRYGIAEADCGGRLFVQSVRDKPIRLAALLRNTPTLNRGALNEIEAEIRAKQIDVFMLDPLVSFHSVAENDNGHMDLLLKEGLGAIASRTETAGELFHHPGKPKPGQADTTVEDGRGASSILWAVRSARVLNFMTPEEAARLGISEDDRRLHIRVMNGKANMGPLGKAAWFKLAVENLPNGDDVACATSWSPPNPFQGVTVADMQRCRTLVQGGAYRVSSQSPDWIGYVVANILKIDVRHGRENDPKNVARIKEILRTWFKNGVLTTEKREDKNRQQRDFVIAGSWQPQPETPGNFDDDTLH